MIIRYNFKFTKKQNLLIFLSIFILLASLYIIKHLNSIHDTPTEFGKKVYDSMNSRSKRVQAYNNAVKLNDGSSANTCVYFLSEVLRMNGEKIPNNICNTTEILDIMKKTGWKKETDYKKLQLGDICFTTDEKINKKGVPTHTYVFMGWKEKNKYDFAYICDNQAKDYNNMIYHERNIIKTVEINGFTKEPFSFFMYK